MMEIRRKVCIEALFRHISIAEKNTTIFRYGSPMLALQACPVAGKTPSVAPQKKSNHLAEMSFLIQVGPLPGEVSLVSVEDVLTTNSDETSFMG